MLHHYRHVLLAVLMCLPMTANATSNELLNDWFQAASGQAVSPATYENGDILKQWTAPDGRMIKTVVKAPHPSATAPNVTMDLVAANQDARPSFEKAIAQVKAQKAGVLLIPKGTYTFSTLDNAFTQLAVQGLSDVTIDGQGSTFVFTQAVTGLNLINVSRVKIKNLTFKYAIRTYSVGTMVKETDKTSPYYGQNILVVDANYPVTAADKIGQLREYDRNCACFVWKTIPYQYYFDALSPKFIGNQKYVGAWPGSGVPGRSFIIFHHYYSGITLKINGGQDITLDNIAITSSTGMSIVGAAIQRGLAIINSKIAPAPGDIISSEYDGINITGGSDIIIDNNLGVGIGDDFINVHSTPYSVSTVSQDKKTITLGVNSNGIVANDVLYFFDGQNNPIGSAKVLAARYAGTSSTVSLDTPIVGADANSFVRALSGIGSRIYINQNTTNMTGNVLVQQPNALIQYNDLNYPITLGAMRTDFFEGTGAINTYVFSNIIRNVSPHDNLDAPWAGINIYGRLFSAMSNTPVNDFITLEKNTIIGSSVDCISVASTLNALITRNVCTDTNLTPSIATMVGQRASINVMKSSDVTLHANQRTGASTGGVNIDRATTAQTRVLDNY